VTLRYKTFGLRFPFKHEGSEYLALTRSPEEEIRSNLIFLITTKKGSRYFMPDFGTNLHQYLFDQLDTITILKIENEIKDSVFKYLPNIKIDKIDITYNDNGDGIKLNIDYTVQNKSMESVDNITIII
jgi:phage baseplate assembly protein W